MNEAEKLTLLEKYNPTLVLLPRGDGTRRRPGAWWRWPGGRGDYYPCPVHLLLGLVTRADKPRPWKLFHWQNFPLIFKAPPSAQPTTEARIQRALAEVEPASVIDWEMDISPLRSGHASRTWEAYQAINQTDPDANQITVYGRCTETESCIALQYWYLYLYNDAPNKHEGDWEMVCIELDKTKVEPKAKQAGYSGHEGGKRRAWEDVKKAPSSGRALVYVARGSHAAYFKAGSFKTLAIGWPKNAIAIVTDVLAVLNTVVSVIPFLGINDHTAKLSSDTGIKVRLLEVGVEVTPELAMMPEEVSDAWWRALDCRWGSSHARVQDFVAPPPPWQQKKKWEQPIGWIRSLKPDKL